MSMEDIAIPALIYDERNGSPLSTLEPPRFLGLSSRSYPCCYCTYLDILCVYMRASVYSSYVLFSPVKHLF
jgi:hypothetical protein